MQSVLAKTLEYRKYKSIDEVLLMLRSNKHDDDIDDDNGGGVVVVANTGAAKEGDDLKLAKSVLMADVELKLVQSRDLIIAPKPGPRACLCP